METKLEIQPTKLRRFLAGTKLYTIRRDHREYSQSIRILCAGKEFGGIVNTHIHTLLSEVPFSVFKEEGFLSFQEALDTLRIFYPDLAGESKVTIVEFRCAL